MTATGFVGLGAMGKHMVRHLRKAGFEVHVYDTSDEAIKLAESHGALRCGSPKEVADRAEIVMICVPTPDIVRKVAVGENGIIRGGKVRIVIDHSTTGPTVARDVAGMLSKHNVVALDGPLAGGVAGAEAGALSVMVSGPKASFEEAEPVLRSFGRNVAHVGNEAGHGQVLKLINNMIVGTSLIATAEAILFGVKSGLEADTILKMLNVSTARSFTTEDILGRRIIERRFDFGFRMELMLKDLRLYVQESERAGAPSQVNALAKQAYELAVARGLGGEDMSRVVEMMEESINAVIGPRKGN